MTTSRSDARRSMTRIVAWFSCGAASAVATKLALAQMPPGAEMAIARIHLADEHPDNNRFAADCERWFGQPIIALTSDEYASAEDVWERRRYMSGPGGAPCTVEMKKAVRWRFEQEWRPDRQVFGYTAEEVDRAQRFREQNAEITLDTPLIAAGLGKADCHAIIARAGIVRPAMYELGFENNNCLGCVKAQSPTYWNRVRQHFPEVFERRATLSREIGCRLVKQTSGDRERIFLDELDPMAGEGEREPEMDCSLLCWMAEREIAA